MIKKGDKVVCVRDYITAEPRRTLYSVGEVSTINSVINSVGYNNSETIVIVWVGGLMMLLSKKDGFTITDLVGDVYFILLNESRKKKLKNLEIVSKFQRYENKGI
jgi:ATP/ADP translocase